MLRRLFWFCLIVMVLAIVVGVPLLFWGYHYITRDLPKLTRIEDYRPPAVSKVFANDGTLVAEFYKDERRYPIKIKDVPPLVRNCFIAAEDAAFYTHGGIDPISIARAFYKNMITGAAKQGGSTITQQVVKNLLLTSEKSIDRKLKEAILSYQIENRFTKDEILELYLNQIFFGSTAYGIKAAAWVYFQKEPKDLTLAEASVLAGLPQAPSRYSPLRNLKDAKRRQHYVLGQMLKAGFITKEQLREAELERLNLRPARTQNIFHAPYYITEVRSQLAQRWKELDIDRDGLEIHLALDIKADELATSALRRGLREVDKRRGWRGPIGAIPGADQASFLEQYRSRIEPVLVPETVVPALVTHVGRGGANLRLWLGNRSATLDLATVSWARRRLSSDDKVTTVRLEDSIKPGDVIEVVLDPSSVKKEEEKKESAPDAPPAELKVLLDQQPEVEGAIVILDPHSGKVVAIVGGYSFQKSVFNRATQSLRQPGSSFKPIVYLAAIDGFGYTPATIVHDSPQTFRIGEQIWSPGNFDSKYMGPITLRTALEKSRNLVSADIVARIGIDSVIQYAKKLGITSPLGRNLSLSLGSSEVTVLEIVRSYGVFAAKGVLFPSVMITRIVDRTGATVYDYESEKLTVARQVLNENSAFLMANMMKGVVDHGTGYRVKELGRPVAGKTGTSNDQMDAWFIGYTPDWVCGVWGGFDVKKEIGEKETGGKVSAPIFVYAMKEFLAYQGQLQYAKQVEESKKEAERLGIEYTPPAPLPPLDFSVPPGVDPFWVDRTTGLKAEPGAAGAIYEYFIKGTEPSKSSIDEADTSSYLESPEL